MACIHLNIEIFTFTDPIQEMSLMESKYKASHFKLWYLGSNDGYSIINLNVSILVWGEPSMNPGNPPKILDNKTHRMEVFYIFQLKWKKHLNCSCSALSNGNNRPQDTNLDFSNLNWRWEWVIIPIKTGRFGYSSLSRNEPI